MSQNITLLGANYPDVPAVELPKTGGGTAKFDDTTDANATSGDIALGKTAYVNGQKLTGSYEPEGLLPTGGTAGQVLTKESSTDYDADWETLPDTVHVGATAPTDPAVKIWLDTNGQGGSVVTSVDGKSGAVSVLPSGGSIGDVLIKSSSADYATEWVPGLPSGGSTGDMLVKSNSADYATEWVLPLSIKLLWTNLSPTSGFPAQTLSLDLSDYSAVIIKLTVNGTSEYVNKTSEGSSICFKGRSAASFNGYLDNNTFNMYRLAIVSDSGIEFSTGYANTSMTSDNYAVPLQIYGIKGIQMT